MAVTAAQLAAYLGIGDGVTDPTGAQGVVITRVLASAQAIVEREGRAAPESIKDEAVTRLAAWLYDAGPAARGTQNAWRASGASALLAPYRTTGAGAIVERSPVTASPGGPGVDAEARRLAALAESTATDALNRANEAIGDIAELLPQVGAAANPATATDAEADAGTETGLRSWSAALIARLVRGIASVLPDHLQTETRGLFSRAGRLFWEIVNEVPDTPGEASGVGHVLTVTGENDRDYAWREPEGLPAGADALDVLVWSRVGTPIWAPVPKDLLDQLGLLQFSIDPPVIQYKEGADATATKANLVAALTRTFNIHAANVDRVTVSQVWRAVSIEGQGIITARTELTGLTALAVNATQAAAIATAIGDNPQVVIRMQLWDAETGGSLVESFAFRVAVVQIPLPATPAPQPPDLTTVQEIGLIQLQLDPIAIAYEKQANASADRVALRRELQTTFKIKVYNPELITGDVWTQLRLQATPARGARVKWSASANELSYIVTTQTADNIANSAISQGLRSLPLEIAFYDRATGGNLLDIVGLSLGIIVLPRSDPSGAPAPVAYQFDPTDSVSEATFSDSQALRDLHAAVRSGHRRFLLELNRGDGVMDQEYALMPAAVQATQNFYAIMSRAGVLARVRFRMVGFNANYVSGTTNLQVRMDAAIAGQSAPEFASNDRVRIWKI